MPDNQHYLDEPRDERGRWTAGGASPPPDTALKTSVSGAALHDLRQAAAGITGAQTLDAMKSASGALADALTKIGPSALGTVIGGAKAGAAKLEEANLSRLAGVLQAEAGSVPDQPAMEPIGHTILNRMQRNGTALVADVAGAYAKKPSVPSEQTKALAQRLLDGSSPDPTGGATHFYSPQHEPRKGQSTVGYDVSGGLESVPGIFGPDGKPAENYRPGFASQPSRFQPAVTPGIPPEVAKFYIQMDVGHVR